MTSDLYPELRDRPPPLSPPRRVLTIGAHPDDAEFGAGATLARWAGDGCDVTMVIATDGSKGSWDPQSRPEEITELRRNEQRRAADVLGAAAVVHLDGVDGELEYSAVLREELARLVRAHRPDIVLTHDPWERYQLHPDHRNTGLAALDAVVAAREPRFYPHHEVETHRPGAVLLWSADEPDHAEPAPAEFIERKIEALLCHSSQSTTTMGDAARSDEQRRAFAERVERSLADAGRRLGTGPAEVFKRLTP
jgi:LmbE family N-acetylglucosaminyl deacetylase